MNLFRKVNFMALIMTIAAATLSLLGIVRTGFYPAIIVLCILPAIPISSKNYVKDSGKVRGALLWVNALVILVVLWMSFVIVHDRVLGDG